MIITGASLLGQILTNRTSAGLLAARAGPAPAEAQLPAKNPAKPEPAPAAVTMSLSTFDALFALQASPRGAPAPANPSARTGAPTSGTSSSLPRMTARTAVDPDLVRAITAALASRTEDDGVAAMGQRSTVSLETSVSRRNSLADALELAGRTHPSVADPQGRAALQ